MAHLSNVTATPTKLKSGAWGARVQANNMRVESGDTVTVRAKSGKSWTATISAIVWSGNGVYLCATQGSDRPARTGRSARNYDPNRFNGYGAPRGGFRKACVSDGNCSSMGSGRSCGGYDCDGY